LYPGVVATNDDATISKASCVEKGYYADEFVKYFLNAKGKSQLKRPPLINRGYFSRVHIWRTVIHYFLEKFPEKPKASTRKQIVSLGGGFDTNFFLLKKEGKLSNCTYYEVDLPEVVQKKIAVIQHYKSFSELLDFTEIEDSESKKEPETLSFHSKDYHILAGDLNTISSIEETLFSKESAIDPNLPTLFLSECVLIYLKPEKGDEVIQWAANRFPVSSFCTYEQIHPNDPFGKVMLHNLENRGCPLLSIIKYPDMPSQIKRYESLGWKEVQVHDMFEIYNRFITDSERKRVESLEFLDELEEWKLIQQHYCIVWAFKFVSLEENKEVLDLKSKEIGFYNLK